MPKCFLPILFAGFAITNLFGQGEWRLAAETDGIRVFVKKAAASDIQMLRVTCELNARIDQVVALLLDAPAVCKWIPHTKTCRYLQKISPTESIYYTEVNMPWPLSNRDFVTHLRLYQDATGHEITIKTPAVPGRLDPVPGNVRIENAGSEWMLTRQDNGTTRLVYNLFVDPGLHFPAAIVNYFSRQAAVEAVKNMRRLVQQPPYRDAALSFIRK